MQSTQIHLLALFPYLMGILMIFGFAGFLFFYLGKNAALRRRWFPRYIIFGSVLFAGFTLALIVPDNTQNGDTPLFPYIVILSATALVAYNNIKVTKFCGNCSKMVRGYWGSPKLCPYCRASLENDPKA